MVSRGAEVASPGLANILTQRTKVHALIDEFAMPSPSAVYGTTAHGDGEGPSVQAIRRVTEFFGGGQKAGLGAKASMAVAPQPQRESPARELALR